MPSPLPVKPNFSVVVAFTLIASNITAQSSAILMRICSVCGDNFGNSQIIMGQRGDRFIGKLHERQKIDGVTALLDAVAEWKRRDVERGISARVVMLD